MSVTVSKSKDIREKEGYIAVKSSVLLLLGKVLIGSDQNFLIKSKSSV